jgi:hypothetical protein
MAADFSKVAVAGIIYGDLPATLGKSANLLASIFRKVGSLSPATLVNTRAVSL